MLIKALSIKEKLLEKFQDDFFYLETNNGIYKLSENLPFTIFSFNKILSSNKITLSNYSNGAVGIIKDGVFNIVSL